MNEIKIENQGLTNSSRFITSDNKVDIDKAFDFYMPSIENLKTNLKFMIENNYSYEEAIFQVKQLADTYYTIFECYKDKIPLK
jgi:hypothetical protein